MFGKCTPHFCNFKTKYKDTEECSPGTKRIATSAEEKGLHGAMLDFYLQRLCSLSLWICMTPSTNTGLYKHPQHAPAPWIPQ